MRRPAPAIGSPVEAMSCPAAWTVCRGSAACRDEIDWVAMPELQGPTPCVFLAAQAATLAHSGVGAGSVRLRDGTCGNR